MNSDRILERIKVEVPVDKPISSRGVIDILDLCKTWYCPKNVTNLMMRAGFVVYKEKHGRTPRTWIRKVNHG